MSIQLFLFVFFLLVGLLSVAGFLSKKYPQWTEQVQALHPLKPLVSLLSMGAAMGALLILIATASAMFHTGGFSGFVWILSLLETLLLIVVAAVLLLSSVRLPGPAGIPQEQLSTVQPLLAAISTGLSFVVMVLHLFS